MAGKTAVLERKAVVNRAVELRGEGLTLVEIGEQVGFSHQAVHNWLRERQEKGCCRCGEDLVRPSVDDLCGFCAGELGKLCPRCDSNPAVNGGRCFDCRGESTK